jgi:quercetin dioxygenase-like cupin family protein
MSNEQAAPETKGVAVESLATVDLGPEIEGMAGRQLRMRMVTIEPGGVFGPIHDHKDRPGIVYILQGTITTIEMESLRTMGREWVGPRIGTPHIGLRTEERFRRWRSRSI